MNTIIDWKYYIDYPFVYSLLKLTITLLIQFQINRFAYFYLSNPLVRWFSYSSIASVCFPQVNLYYEELIRVRLVRHDKEATGDKRGQLIVVGILCTLPIRCLQVTNRKRKLITVIPVSLSTYCNFRVASTSPWENLKTHLYCHLKIYKYRHIVAITIS